MCIGSMSQLDMQRNMPHTHTMWTKSLGGTVMEGYTAMSDHGAMALLPILTGRCVLKMILRLYCTEKFRCSNFSNVAVIERKN